MKKQIKIGCTGTAKTDLRRFGNVLFEGQLSPCEAISNFGLIEKGSRVRVVDFNMRRIVVAKAY